MRRWSVLARVVAVVLLFASVAQAQAPEKSKITIGVGGKPLFGYLPLTIAESKGYFKAEGLDVAILDLPDGARALQALLGGSVDLVSGAYEHTISQQAKGQSIEAIVLQGRYSAIVLLMPRAKASAYKSPKDLKGMKIGVTAPGSSSNLLVNILLAKDGLPPDSVSIVGAGASAGAVAMMQRGELDALAQRDPVVSQLEATGNFVSVVDTRTAKGMQEAYGGAYAAGCIYAPTEFTKKYPGTAQAVVNAMVRALRFIQASTPDQIVDAVPTSYYTDRGAYKAALEKNLETFRHDGSITLEAQRNVQQHLLTFDPAMKGAKIDRGRTVNMTFQQKAAQRFR